MPDRMYSPYSKEFYNQIDDEFKPLPMKKCICRDPREFYIQKQEGTIFIYCDKCGNLWGKIRYQTGRPLNE